MGKSKRRHTASKSKRSSSLADQILANNAVKASSRIKIKEVDEKDDEYVDEKLSKKILEQARRQQEELEEEHGVHTKKARFQTVSLGSTEDSDPGDESDTSEADHYYDNIEINEEDEKALECFMSAKPVMKRTLADIIMEKLTEKQTEVRTQLSDASVQVQQLDDRVVAMYRGVRDILAKYRSGKLPKALKVVPHLANWEQILYITEPERWSAAAMYQVTRIFASNLNAKMAQRFFYLVLFPRIRDDISEYKRLNFHLYMATRKALFKPAAFFKGILLPLCECGTCTLREAVIVSSVLTKNSIPMLHSAAAILKIAEMDYTGANSIFLRALLDKKYALPYRVIDAVVFHFIRFKTDRRELPVLWHQCLLTFVQRYKQDVSSEQKAALFDVMRTHKHHSITPEIRRELDSARCRDEEVEQPQSMADDE